MSIVANEDGVANGAIDDAKRATRKVIVAIHGIGQQYQNATIQSVVHRFCSYYNVPAAIPLGRFQLVPTNDQTPAAIPIDRFRPPFDPKQSNLAFAEVYWADVCRDEVEKGYTIEQAKAWARTIADGVRSTCDQGSGIKLSDNDHRSLKTILQEMVDALGVIDRLSQIGKFTGVFDFSLKRVLEDFVNDVQIVTEYEGLRTTILDRFGALLQRIVDESKTENVEIHIVSHSEGTVVALLSLLRAFARKPGEDHWANHVRGLMTIGSPLDKHLILWSRIFEPFQKPCWRPTHPIRWKNYYDFGDPVGFKLNTTRRWLSDNGWLSEHDDGRGAVFRFRATEDDIGFSRYFLPGKAHVDYWHDDHVFGNFIEDVVRPAENATGDASATRDPIRDDYRTPPGNVRGAATAAHVVPYLIVFLICYLAAYLQYKAAFESGAQRAPSPSSLTTPTTMTTTTKPAASATAPQNNVEPNQPSASARRPIWSVFKRAASTAFLLAASIAATRILTLTRTGKWRWIAVFVWLLAAFVYVCFAPADGFPSSANDAALIAASMGAIVLLARWIDSKYPTWGVRPLVIMVGIVLVSSIAWWATHVSVLRLWPVCIAAVAFLYLFWLAVLIFDLSFIWHRYIRHEAAFARWRSVPS